MAAKIRRVKEIPRAEHTGGGTSRKCWHMINPVCVWVCVRAPLWPNTCVHTVSDTPPISLCWWWFFIFSSDRVSSPSCSAWFSSQKCSTTQLPVTWSAAVPAYVTRSSAAAAAAAPSEALIAGGGGTNTRDASQKLRRIWNCQVTVMLCHQFERMQRQLLARDQNWQVR